MRLLEKIDIVFQETDLQELDINISNVCDELEYCELSDDEITKAINCLLAHINYYKDATIIENILNGCLRIMEAHSVFSGFDLDCVLPCLDTLSNECLSYLLTFMGFSGEEKYRKYIESFLTRAGLEKEASEALLELDYRTKSN